MCKLRDCMCFQEIDALREELRVLNELRDLDPIHLQGTDRICEILVKVLDLEEELTHTILI